MNDSKSDEQPANKSEPTVVKSDNGRRSLRLLFRMVFLSLIAGGMGTGFLLSHGYFAEESIRSKPAPGAVKPPALIADTTVSIVRNDSDNGQRMNYDIYYRPPAVEKFFDKYVNPGANKPDTKQTGEINLKEEDIAVVPQLEVPPLVIPPQQEAVPDGWCVDLSDPLMECSKHPGKVWFIVAHKSAGTPCVTAYKVNIKTGVCTELFSFEEGNIADNSSGNYWEGLPPGAALSPDGKQVAYTDCEGLKIFNLRDGYSDVIIRKIDSTEEHRVPEKGAEWSNELLDGIVDLHNPEWSADGRYISVECALYEGSILGVIDSRSWEFSFLEETGNFAWAPRGSSFSISASVDGYDSPPGIYMFSRKDVGSETLYLVDIYYTGSSVSRMLYSPDMRMFAFKQRISLPDSFEEDENWILMDINATKSVFIGSAPTVEVLTFTPDSRGLLYAESHENYLSIYHFDTRSFKTKKLVSLLPRVHLMENSFHWLSNGQLALAADHCGNADASRFVLLDLHRQSVDFASPMYSGLLTLVGHGK